MTSAATTASDRVRPAFDRAWFLVGFALGGFFDGILLHQILQWHHLLSLVEGAEARGPGFQITADGLFHASMYAIAVAGLWLAVRTRRGFAAPGAGRRAIAGMLLGFGVWNVVDIVLVHWLLALHRVRLDTDFPLAWDLLWLAVFGLAFVAAGWRLRRRAA